MSYFLDFRPYGTLWSHHGIAIRDVDTATRFLEQVRARVADGNSLSEVLASYMPEKAKLNSVGVQLIRWLEIKRRAVEAHDLSPTYHRELKRYAREGGEFSYLAHYSVYEIDFAALEDWSLWLADRGLSPKTRRNVLVPCHTKSWG